MVKDRDASSGVYGEIAGVWQLISVACAVTTETHMFL